MNKSKKQMRWDSINKGKMFLPSSLSAEESGANVPVKEIDDCILPAIIDSALRRVNKPEAWIKVKLRSCPLCNKGNLIERKGKFGTFMGCTCYPACTYTES